jgi:hypothetical protein
MGKRQKAKGKRQEARGRRQGVRKHDENPVIPEVLVLTNAMGN